MAREWLLRRGTKIVGPVSDGKLVALAKAGKLLQTDEVSCDAGKTYKSVSHIESLRTAIKDSDSSIAATPETATRTMTDVRSKDVDLPDAVAVASSSSEVASAVMSQPKWYTDGAFQSLSVSDIAMARDATKLRTTAMAFAGGSLLVPILHLVAIPLGIACLSRRKKALLNPRLKRAVDTLKKVPNKSLRGIAGQKKQLAESAVAQMVLTDSAVFFPFIVPLIQVGVVGGLIAMNVLLGT